jgi:uroporphyrinogen-III synthase
MSLKGRTILVTRSAGQALQLTQLLEAKDATVYTVPAIA